MTSACRLYFTAGNKTPDVVKKEAFEHLEKLEALLEETGWEILRIIPSYGTPPQGYVYVTKARDADGKP